MPIGEEELDHDKLAFGKYAGKTPNEIAEKDPQYIVWMYDNVKNRRTCSKLLRDECAKSPRKLGMNPAHGASYGKPATPKPTHQLKNHFDDYDDDIPF